MATKNEVSTPQKQAELVVNNSFINALAEQLNEKCKYGMSFPEDYNVTNALTGAYLIMLQTEDKNGKNILESCSKASIANSLMDMATLGLSVQKKQGYFIAYGGKCQFQKSYFGNITIARRFGMKDVRAEVIYENDVFSYHLEDGIKVLDKHEQDFINIDNSKIKGAYAIVVMNDGTKYLEVMNIKQIEQSWKQGYGYKEKGGTHEKFADQMCKKTVINRALKSIINTHGDVFVQDADERTEYISPDEILEENVAYEIKENANTEVFEIEEKPEPATIPETKPKKQKEPVEVVESQETELPDFMKQE